MAGPGKGYGLVPQGRVGTGAAQVFDNSQVLNTMQFIMGEVKKDKQRALLLKNQAAKDSRESLDLVVGGFEADLKQSIFPMAKDVRDFHASEMMAGRDPNDPNTASGQEFLTRKNTYTEAVYESDQFTKSYTTALTAFDERFHDEDDTDKLWVDYRMGDADKRRDLLEEYPDLLVEKPFDVLKMASIISEQSIGMTITAEGHFKMDEFGVLHAGVVTKADEFALATAAKEMLRDENWTDAAKERGITDPIKQHEWLKGLLTLGKDTKETEQFRNEPKDDGNGFAINFNAGGASSEHYNWGITKTPAGELTKADSPLRKFVPVNMLGTTAEEKDQYVIEIDYSKKPELSNLDWPVKKGNKTAVMNGRLNVLFRDKNGEWQASITSSKSFRSDVIDPKTGEGYRVRKGETIIIPYDTIEGKYKNKFQAPGAQEMINTWEGQGAAGGGTWDDVEPL